MKKHILFLLIATIFVGCGEDVDIEEFMEENEIDNYITKPGDVKNITASSATIGILRQSVSEDEYMSVVPSKRWSTSWYIYGTSYKIPNKTDLEITIEGLSPATTYYCFQSTKSGEVSASKIGNKYVTFTTEEYDVKKLGLHHVIITAGADKLCYSLTNPTPTIDDYTWTVTKGEATVTATVTDLMADKKYYVRSYADGKYGNVITIQTSSNDNFANAIDLGLSVKWADRMLLAEGELPLISNYSFCFGETTAYYYYYDYFTTGSGSDLSNDNDAAVYHWGGKWRMPTKEEVEELASLPAVKTKMNGVEGLLIYGKPGTPYSNNSIFIPYYRYWTRNAYSSSSSYYFNPYGEELKTVSGDITKCHYIIPVQK